jgi:UTP-glucose-1-phosphate uridylyltransferase
MAEESRGPALLIMAAGRGSRFGGLKQLEPIGPHGEAVMEYSIYDGLAGGFAEVVLVIRSEQEKLFRTKIVEPIAGRARVMLVHQLAHVGLQGRSMPPGREKPWGTAHAVLTAREAIRGPFAVLNADDFYGPAAIRAICTYLRRQMASQSREGAMVGYRLRNTLSAHGPVARGVCERDAAGYLTRIVEYQRIARQPSGEIIARGEAGERALCGNELVSLNLWAFPPAVFGLLETEFAFFLSRSPGNHQEFEIPTVVGGLIEAGDLRVRLLEIEEPWCGVTYREDVATVQSRLASLIEDGVYPARLWQVPKRQ